MQQLEQHAIQVDDNHSIALKDLAKVTLRPAPRQGTFEQDGNEVVAGVVHMQPESDTITVTETVLRELRAIQRELPTGWRCVPCYDRTSLIRSAMQTVTRTLLEALAVTSICIVIVMRHWRSSLHYHPDSTG